MIWPRAAVTAAVLWSESHLALDVAKLVRYSIMNANFGNFTSSSTNIHQKIGVDGLDMFGKQKGCLSKTFDVSVQLLPHYFQLHYIV